ncbi:nicotinamide-nucleotide amidase [Rhodococcus sp. PvR044]|jgi:nicotinamide-nucleotide amidase|uniref:CinA family protein n=1 Tax=Rhodococcus TaxID=1827 RepID=UPI000BCB6EA9|nr:MULTISPECIES: CinA family protein [Rhodococcus]MBP1158294.1 nicotinamide-nucleotide amidase [Rhodococcus sp. PvR099]MCZ4554141.1 CinA family protein [Rhodococcus maanshanensis]PTR43731.1 nicotinamide-nucleotide amidase [Rhodococcus sp. OK611]SNX90549.1 nicotinamide-nucleotide amidase [Rhodococcus sp. OK270]
MGNESKSVSVSDLAERVAGSVSGRGWTVATAESLTSGQVAAALGAAPDASLWFRGGVVAYSSDVKRSVLGVPDGPVVSEAAARSMATGVARLLGADLAVSVTGAGGPEGQDGQEPGTVWLAVTSPVAEFCEMSRFDGTPAEVVQASLERALELLAQCAIG